MRSSSVGVGGDPPVPTHTLRWSGPPSEPGSHASIVSTVGGAQKCVMFDVCSSRQTSAGSGRGMQTWVAPAAVTAQVKHQPWQWNIGNVHRYVLPGPSPAWYAMASACRYAPRCWYITPLGRPV